MKVVQCFGSERLPEGMYYRRLGYRLANGTFFAAGPFVDGVSFANKIFCRQDKMLNFHQLVSN